MYYGINFYFNVFLQKFKLMLLKKEEASKNALLSQLSKIDEHLGKRGNRFLTGDTLCCFDCELMPRLQHIRVAGWTNAFSSIVYLHHFFPFLSFNHYFYFF